MPLRDEVESVLRAWNIYELARDAPAVIDFDCHPQPANSIGDPLDRLSAYWKLLKVHQAAIETGDTTLAERVNAHLTYLRALMGERISLDEYVSATQGCHAKGWPEPYIEQVGETTDPALTQSESAGMPTRGMNLPIASKPSIRRTHPTLSNKRSAT